MRDAASPVFRKLIPLVVRPVSCRRPGRLTTLIVGVDAAISNALCASIRGARRDLRKAPRGPDSTAPAIGRGCCALSDAVRPNGPPPVSPFQGSSLELRTSTQPLTGWAFECGPVGASRFVRWRSITKCSCTRQSVLLTIESLSPCANSYHGSHRCARISRHIIDRGLPRLISDVHPGG